MNRSRSLRAFSAVLIVVCCLAALGYFPVAKLRAASPQPQFLLTVSANPPAGGTVSPATPTSFDSGTIVPISAIAAPGYIFVNWTSTGDPVANSTAAFTTIPMNAAESVTANFKSVTFTESWVSLFTPANPGPAARSSAAAANDPTGNMVLFGGSNGTSLFNDTWLWFGDQWVQTLPPAPPSARWEAGMSLDTVNQQTVMFGGNSTAAGITPLGDTWLWNGSSWTLASVTSPSARVAPAMAFDQLHGHTVLFGGNTGSASANDTWTWDGTQWSQISSSTNPPARSGASMVYDAAHGQILMFGGQDGSTFYNDTWVWDGTNWTQLLAANSPAARFGAAMAFDSQHAQVVLMGGITASGAVNDTWLWNGSNWTSVATPGPSARSGSSMVFTAGAQTGGQIFLFGGTNGTKSFNDDWIFDAPAAASSILGTAQFGAAYDYIIPVVGGVGPYSFTQDGRPESLSPFGLSLNSSTGAITGNVTAAGGQDIPAGITITDSQGFTTDVTFTLPVENTAISFQPLSLPDATTATNYDVQFSATGGFEPYTFSETGLGGGLSLNSSGQIVGQCTAGSSNVVITATDSIAGSASQNYSVNCNPLPQITTTSPITNGVIGVPYNFQFAASGGTPQLLWTLTPGNLPAGFSINAATGVLTGTASSPVVANFSVSVTDFWGAVNSKNFQLNIPATLTLTAPSSAAQVGVPYSSALVATGGVAPYTFSISVGSLPPVLSLNTTTGAITGTPTTANTYNFTAKVVDSSGTPAGTVTTNGSIVVAPAASATVTVSPASPVSFGTVYLGTIASKNFTVTNTGTKSVTITGPILSLVQGGNSKEFVEVNECPKSLAGGAHCTISVSFVAGPFYTPQMASLTIMTNAPVNPPPVMLSALVIDPQASFKPTSLNFGTISFGKSSAPQTVTLTNTGAGSVPLNITSISVTGTNAANFVANSSACPASLAPGAHCAITITFTPPKNSGSYSANLTVKDNAQSATQTVSLTGKGSR